MSTYSELFVPQYMDGAPLEEWEVTNEVENRMAKDLGADSLRYLPVTSVSRAIGLPEKQLCRACITGEYPTIWGKKLSAEAFDEYQISPEGQTFNGQRLGLIGGR
jgi:amidophosphoribosyltransferase